MTDNVINCSICSCEFTEDESGVIGEFGMMPVAFCPTCFTSMLDMADQFNIKEWEGLTVDEMFDCLLQSDGEAKRLPFGFKWFAEAIEAKLKEKNT
jgi:hypothetical protein